VPTLTLGISGAELARTHHNERTHTLQSNPAAMARLSRAANDELVAQSGAALVTI